MKYLVISQASGCTPVCEIIASDIVVAKEYAGRNQPAMPEVKYYINGTTDVEGLLYQLGQSEAVEVNSLHELKAKIKISVHVIDGKLAIEQSPLVLGAGNLEISKTITKDDTGFVVESCLEYKSSDYIHLETVIQDVVVTTEEYLDAGFELSETIQAMYEVLEA